MSIIETTRDVVTHAAKNLCQRLMWALDKKFDTAAYRERINELDRILNNLTIEQQRAVVNKTMSRRRSVGIEEFAGYGNDYRRLITRRAFVKSNNPLHWQRLGAEINRVCPSNSVRASFIF